eukprot:gene27099-2323_t
MADGSDSHRGSASNNPVSSARKQAPAKWHIAPAVMLYIAPIAMLYIAPPVMLYIAHTVMLHIAPAVMSDIGPAVMLHYIPGDCWCSLHIH